MGEHLTTETFVERARKVHGDTFFYENAVYTRSDERIRITCRKHGDFDQFVLNHLKGNGCAKCRRETNPPVKRYSYTYAQFVNAYHNKWGAKYKFPEFDIIERKQFVKAICNKHGEFQSKCMHLLAGHGCQKCGQDGTKTWTEEEMRFLEEKYNKYGPKLCGIYLKKNPRTVTSKASYMGLLDQKGDPTFVPGKLNLISRAKWYSYQKGAMERGFEFEITVDYAEGLLIKQNNKCALSGVGIEFSKDRKVCTASIDRINSDIGYIEGNIQIVHKLINKLKLNLDERTLYRWCKSITEYRKDLN